MAFGESMQRGNASLNRGNVIAAWWHFRAACRVSPDSSEAHQLRGVCLRLLRCYLLARKAFCKAYRHAQNDIHQRGKVLRDDSKILLARKNYAAALRRLDRSWRLLASDGTPLPPEVRREYWMTIAFLGHAQCRIGDKKRGRAIIEQAVLQLRGDTPYELNALTYLIASLPWWERTDRLPRAFRLAANNRKRRFQLRLLCVNASLAYFLFP